MIFTFLVSQTTTSHPLEGAGNFMFESFQGRIVFAEDVTAYTRMKIADWLDVAA